MHVKDHLGILVQNYNNAQLKIFLIFWVISYIIQLPTVTKTNTKLNLLSMFS